MLDPHAQVIEKLMTQISNGAAIMFAGAGFSLEATDCSGGYLIRSSDLSSKICEAGGFPDSHDLRYSSQRFIREKTAAPIIELLKNTFTVKSVSPNQISICSLPWRRFYTTNYDKSIEMSSMETGKVVETVNIADSSGEYYKRPHICVHLNGSIDILTTETLNSSFKLSTSSYVSSDSFLSSNWAYVFKKDLERSSAIVFVGYSLYDIEIQKILLEGNGLFKEKTYFIVSQDDAGDDRLIFTLAEHGAVIPIGVASFADRIRASDKFTESKPDHVVQAFSMYALGEDCPRIKDSKIEAMLMYGDIDDSFIDDAVSSSQSTPYFINRDDVSKVYDFLVNGKNIVVHGDMGNGKTYFLRELKSFLTIKGYDVYTIQDMMGDYISDMDHIDKLRKDSVIIVDSYEQSLELIKHYSLSVPGFLKIIAAARTSEHERNRTALSRMGFHYNEINVDILSVNESSTLVQIIDNLGLWGEQSGSSFEAKLRYINKQSNAQLSLFLLGLLESPQMLHRVNNLTSGLLLVPEIKDTFFAICFLGVLDLKCTFSIVSEVAGNSLIYSANLRADSCFNNLFKFERDHVDSKSGLFCLSLIRHQFGAAYVAQQLQKIASNFNLGYGKDYLQEKIFKATLKFSFIERILPGANKLENLKNYYELLKTSVSWLKHDPHYWLQYGMAYITHKDYPRAQQWIDNAYAIASGKYNYNTASIDMQQARLYLLRAAQLGLSKEIFDLFTEANLLLSRRDNDIYKFRQVEKYKNFYDSCFDKLNKKHRGEFYHACKRMLKSISSSTKEYDMNLEQSDSFMQVTQGLNYIISSIDSANADS